MTYYNPKGHVLMQLFDIRNLHLICSYCKKRYENSTSAYYLMNFYQTYLCMYLCLCMHLFRQVASYIVCVCAVGVSQGRSRERGAVWPSLKELQLERIHIKKGKVKSAKMRNSKTENSSRAKYHRNQESDAFQGHCCRASNVQEISCYNKGLCLIWRDPMGCVTQTGLAYSKK